MDKHDEILVAIRQIIRAIDLHSKKLSKEYGMTGPQLILMRAIQEMGNVTIKELSNQTNVSQATTTTIIDRLELNGYVQRVRSSSDRRKVHANLTEKGQELLNNAPPPLQDNFVKKFQNLEPWEQSLLLSSMQRVSAMMNAEDIDAAPVLQLEGIANVAKS
ncbi:MAG: MarR family winged helix-turn-helix transcriptional regulator [Vibrio toranzoniae]|uniref:MarR family transcriptional regulator n=1 Tax=Vibrio toranzoniae TaxID=1194427 RepID=A0A120DFQ3_9VIBR|nr:MULTISPECIES: MarR family winged helix-turn-helix transcriptional regulator [Vibrio]KWT99670.1 MarR family transcriptional regulator [Vibrio toranzoniae]MDA0142883.1 MarR family winged helix-turn-helix transcriptional regulator [Vibrio sp. RW]NAZ52435.1 MarR family transcriptional regulator [Vibrio toranzoniae]NAZ71119.1 MarR family transcriptional regulator [Vibrio toranzoniae]NAZ91086.1 MarR family transcriptional regulator [Vibrio toranzoniae]